MTEKIIAFDSKDFKRSKTIRKSDTDNSVKIIEKTESFFSPLGVGVCFKNSDLFEKAYLELVSNGAINFSFQKTVPFYCSSQLKREIGPSKATKFCDTLVRELESYIEFVHFSYVILPPDKIPKVSVGGYKSEEKEVDTRKFLRDISPMFPYLTLWSLSQKRKLHDFAVHLDGFRSKRTIAWDEITKVTTPKVFPRGDECNPFISFADIIAFLTDVKLYNADYTHRQLKPDNLKYVWEDYGFPVDIRFIDEKSLKFYKWYNDELIDLRPYLARPVVFLMVDEIEKIEPKTRTLSLNQTELEIAASEQKPRKFHEVIQRMKPYYLATTYAYQMGGCVQFFDKYTDSDKMQDGDVIIYMGEYSKKIAQTYSDAFDVDVMTFKELKTKMRE